ncbi:GlxA family transcriptional regulator [Pseudoduganella violaceinigra]|uniref:GlxA family transcriptional regulator n=1 Tax=Pseudoduganella violaceinigra TaxID=246602 RepID=UPI001B7F7F2E|nr:helix-turn-helix domain-containing protein [Pseudoduganella violaceinigra]
MLIRELLAVAGTLNAREPDLKAAAMFDVTLVGPTLQPVRSFTGPALLPERSLRTARQANVLVLPSFYGDVPAVPSLLRWIVKHYEAGGCILASASGVRVLAATGLLDGRDATCNLADRRSITAARPAVRLSPQSPLVVDGRLITAASITPTIDACAHLVSHFHGEKAALKFARYANSARQLADVNGANGRNEHTDARVQAAQRYIEQHNCAGITPDDVARHVAMSQRNLARRFHATLGVTPVQYILQCRIEQAKRLLARPNLSLRRVAIETGFSDETVFRRAFKQLEGKAPSAWRTLFVS